MKTAIVYHQVKKGVDCPDGIVSAWIVNKVYPEATIIGCCYQSEIPVFLEKTNIVIVDFSFKKDVINQWLNDGHTITVLDHHKTALDELSNFSTTLLGKIDISPDTSGARLTWQHFLVESEPLFIKYIVDRDNFNFRIEETNAFHEAFSSLRSLCPTIESKFAFFNALEYLTDDELRNWLVPIGEELLKPKKEAIAKALERVEFTKIGGFDVPIIKLNASEERLTSDICMAMYRGEYRDSPFVACVNEDEINYSLRSDKFGNNFDVSAVAKQYGGGGHRNASGFRMVGPN
jgi:uncharacterized protein